MGSRLATESNIEADLVIGVPDSGVPSAIGYATWSEALKRSSIAETTSGCSALPK